MNEMNVLRQKKHKTDTRIAYIYSMHIEVDADWSINVPQQGTKAARQFLLQRPDVVSYFVHTESINQRVKGRVQTRNYTYKIYSILIYCYGLFLPAHQKTHSTERGQAEEKAPCQNQKRNHRPAVGDQLNGPQRQLFHINSVRFVWCPWNVRFLWRSRNLVVIGLTRFGFHKNDTRFADGERVVAFALRRVYHSLLEIQNPK